MWAVPKLVPGIGTCQERAQARHGPPRAWAEIPKRRSGPWGSQTGPGLVGYHSGRARANSNLAWAGRRTIWSQLTSLIGGLGILQLETEERGDFWCRVIYNFGTSREWVLVCLDGLVDSFTRNFKTEPRRINRTSRYSLSERTKFVFEPNKLINFKRFNRIFQFD